MKMLGRLKRRWRTKTYAYPINDRTVKRRDDKQWRKEYDDEQTYPELENDNGS